MLQISDDNVDLRNKRAAGRSTDVNALCRFWRQASRVFTALSLVWNCNCRPQHLTRLLLEHRTSTPTEFRLSYSKDPQKSQETRRIRVSEKRTEPDNSATIHNVPRDTSPGNVPSHNPNHRGSAPKSSALKTSASLSGGNVRYLSPIKADSPMIGRLLTTTIQGTRVGHHHPS